MAGQLVEVIRRGDNDPIGALRQALDDPVIPPAQASHPRKEDITMVRIYNTRPAIKR
jgi:hypothetical protein